MANTPKKVKDPTEVALSAIQEALNISDTTVDTSRNSIGGELSPPTPSAAPTYSETPFDTRGSAERHRQQAAGVPIARSPGEISDSPNSVRRGAVISTGCG